MARPLRLEYAGAIWHVTTRGNREEEIVLDDEETDESDPRVRRRGPDRKAFALLARRLASAPLREVADVLGINPWSASHSASAGEMLEREDQAFRRRLKSANDKLGKLARRQT